MQETKRKKFIIDTDPGIDDMMAILYLIHQPNIQIEMISLVDGNVSLENVTANSKKIIKMSDKVFPLYKGSFNPILKTVCNLNGYHYNDGLGDVEEIKNYNADDILIEKESSIIKLIETIKKNENDINLICLGPLTTIAAAFMLEPCLPKIINSIYMMGGSYLSLGNTIPTSEFNFVYDFVATKIVFNNFKNIIITPWEPTAHAGLTINSETMNNINKNFITKQLKRHEARFGFSSLIIDKYTKEKGDTFFCDLYAVIPLIKPKSVKKFSLCKLNIIIDSFEMRGMSVVNERRIMEMDYDLFIETEFEKYKNKGYHIVIEEFNDKIVLEEFEHIFIHHNIN